MFLNFKRAFLHAREKLPFALAQVGKVLRNEISPRRGMHRLREFTIMELELFFDPKEKECPWFGDVKNDDISLLTEKMESEGVKNPLKITIEEAVDDNLILTEWQGYFMGISTRFITHLGVKPVNQRFRAHLPKERAHYSAQTYDHEVYLEGWDWTEIAGHAHRTDYDLISHQVGSGEDMSVIRENNTRFVPHVVEPSFGLDRLVYLVLESNYKRKKKRNIFSFPRELSPYQVSIFPLVNKDELPEKAKKVEKLLRETFVVFYDERGSIGRRYARSDEIGTPLAITIDYYTMEKDIITIRHRDKWKQVTQEIQELSKVLSRYFTRQADFDELGIPMETDTTRL
jgi:glycyl-tRNA synthetase